MTLSERIIKVAKEKNITFSELGRISGDNRTVISKAVKGWRIGNPAIKRLAAAFGEEFEQYYEHAICQACGKDFIPANGKQKTCSAKCAKDNNANWKKSHYRRNVACETDAQRFGWGAKVRRPAVSFAEYNERARSQGLSYGQLQGLERLGLR